MAEDQANEIEALQSIFCGDGDFEALNGPPTTRFALRLVPNMGGEDNYVGVSLVVTYPPTYPEELPVLELPDAGVKGLDAKKMAELRDVAAACAAENLGMPSIYTVAERIREWLSERNEKPGDGSAFDEMMKRQRAKERGDTGSGKGPQAYSKEADPSIKRKTVVSAEEVDEAIRRKRDGTPVTPETFAAWRAAFEVEMERKRKEDEEKGIATIGAPRGEKGRLTGRQLFEADASLAASDAAAGEAGEEDALAGRGGGAGGAAAGGAGGASYAIDASLFEGDLPSDEEDDDDYEPSDDDEDEDEDDDDDDDDE